MNIAEILGQLRAERSRLDAAIQALEGGGGTSKRGRGRPPGTTNKPAGDGTRRRRQMSAAARKRISDAMRQRWAAVRAAKK